jgi:hypothetical protein
MDATGTRVSEVADMTGVEDMITGVKDRTRAVDMITAVEDRTRAEDMMTGVEDTMGVGTTTRVEITTKAEIAKGSIRNAVLVLY